MVQMQRTHLWPGIFTSRSAQGIQLWIQLSPDQSQRIQLDSSTFLLNKEVSGPQSAASFFRLKKKKLKTHQVVRQQ